MLAPEVVQAIDQLDEAGQLGPTKALLVIASPPCDHCAHWSPEVITDQAQRQIQVRMCHAPEQLPDFSCFEPIP